MDLTAWSPIAELEPTSEHLGHLFDGLQAKAKDQMAIPSSGQAPSMDAMETYQTYLIRAELRDLRKEELKMFIKDGALILESAHQTKDARRKVRSFLLPDTVDEKKMSVDFVNGVLEITFPKHKHGQPQAEL